MNLEQVNAKPARWWTLLGLVLVPLLVAGGFLVAGLNDGGRLHTVKAAVVNLDDPVTVNGQYTPLGRQLTANLVDSQRVENLTWTLDTEDNARAGLANGSYAAMVVIPKNFSAAATSYAKGAADAEHAVIELSTSPVAGVADGTLGKAVAMEAATALNQTLTSGYLDKIYIGFNDMGDQFQTMADGSRDLAKGASSLSDGITQASDGSAQLATGVGSLASGMGTLASKTASLPSSTKKLSTGTSTYVTGVNQLIDQTIAALPSQVALADGVDQLSQGATGVSSGLSEYQSGLESNATQAQDTADTLEQLLVAAAGGSSSAATSAVTMIKAACDIDTETSKLSTDGPICVASLTATAKALDGAAAGLDTKDSKTGESLKSGAAALASGLSKLDAQLQASLPDVAKTTAQLKALKSGGNKLASGVSQLADGMPALSDGIDSAASGASKLADGAQQLSSGLSQASSGGVKLADGTWKLADGIAQGKDKLPSYTKSDRKNLADVVSQPISTDGLTGLANPNVGWISLLLVLALWLGAMTTYLVLKAATRGLLGAAEPTFTLIVEALAPGVAVVLTQAAVLSGLAHLGLGLTWQKSLAVTGLLLLAGFAFALINHALVIWASGFGRIVALLLAVIGTAPVIAPAAPGWLSALRPISPMTPVLDAMRAVITESSGASALTFVVVGWLLVGVLASSVGIARKRTTSLAAVLAV